MRYGLLLVALFVLVSLVPPSQRASSGPTLEITFVQWTPGEPPLRSDTPDVFSRDRAIIDEYRIGGTAKVVTTVAVESPSGLDARLVVLLLRPITMEPAIVRLPLPVDGTTYWQQGPETTNCWLLFPRYESRFDQYLSLTMDATVKAGGDQRLLYNLVDANGSEHSGVAGRWAQPTTQSN